MFFYASKILAFLLNPLIWIIFLLIIGIFAVDQKRRRNAALLGTMLLIIFSNGFLLDEAMRKWEVPATKYEDLKKYDIGIVLGGIMFYDGEYDRLQFFRSTDRLLQAIELYKKGYIKKIFFVSGSGSILYQDIKEAVLAKRYLLTIGIPESDIIIESESKNTHENAVNARGILEKQFPGKSCLLISSGMHLKRANACFKKEGMNLDLYSTDRYAGPRKFEFDYAFIPNTNTLDEWNVLIHEIAGYLIYRVAGYI
jgi:uncharacterized SAM-binding protein YcdF (DUF218 family)